MKSPLAVLFCAVGVAATPMAEAAEVNETMEIAASPDAVWKAIADFGELETWLPGIAACEISEGKEHEVGAVRLLTLGDGAQLTEKLHAWDPETRSMTYSIVESPLPMENYRSTITVHEADGGSRVEWHGTFDAGPEQTAGIHATYQSGLGNLKQMLEGR